MSEDPRRLFEIHIAGTARDCAIGLRERLEGLERAIARLDCRVHFHIVENDSSDTTREVLQDFASSRSSVTLLLLDDLTARYPKREDRLAACRNMLLDSIAATSAGSSNGDADRAIYLPVDLDLDIDWSNITTELEEAIRAIHRGDVDGIFPSSTPRYYDIHALRAPGWNTRDAWVMLGESRSRAIAKWLPKWILRAAHIHALQVPPQRLMRSGPMFKVDSAFGGFGVYRLQSIIDRTYASTAQDNCEHVAFNRGLRLAIRTTLVIPAPEEHLENREVQGAHRRAITALIYRTRRLPQLSSRSESL